MNAKALFGGLLMSAVLLAQPPGGPRGFGPGPGGPGGRGFGPGGPPNQVVTGAPYSGVEVRTRSQVLANGTVIQNQEQTKVARDGQGRVRREATSVAPDGTTHTRISISDPVAGVVYELDPARKMAFSRPAHFPNSSGQPPSGRQLRQPNAQAPADSNVTHETMAAKSVNGVTASGTRTTRTLPAGTIGNSQPIQTVHETWMSDDLKVPVQTTMTDPRNGTTSTQLTNILRGEPDMSLFQVPSDYTVRKGGPGGPGGRGPRPGGPPPGNQQ
jgi:hypothetical protein